MLYLYVRVPSDVLCSDSVKTFSTVTMYDPLRTLSLLVVLGAALYAAYLVPHAMRWAFVLAVLYLATRIDTWLPFLGPTVLPTTAIPLHEGTGQMRVDLRLPCSGSSESPDKIMYWAANQGDRVYTDPRTAYGSFKNAGVSRVPAGARLVTVAIDPPGEYMGLRPHVHYRLGYPSGLWSRVYTKETK